MKTGSLRIRLQALWRELTSAEKKALILLSSLFLLGMITKAWHMGI